MSFFANFFSGGEEDKGGSASNDPYGGTSTLSSHQSAGTFSEIDESFIGNNKGRSEEQGITVVDTEMDDTQLDDQSHQNKAYDSHQDKNYDGSQIKTYDSTHDGNEKLLLTEENEDFTNMDQGADEEIAVNEDKAVEKELSQEYVEDSNHENADVENQPEVDDVDHAVASLPLAIGALTCLCVPTRVSGFKDFLDRMFTWTILNKNQFISGVAVSVAQVPEVTSYALMAGVSPLLALQATWVMGIVTALFGGRPGMISGTTASVAIALINLVNSSGVEYVFYAVSFAGLLQMAFGLLKLGGLLRFVPYSAMIGFVNVMGVIITFSLLKFFKVPGVGINQDAGGGRAYEVGYHDNHYRVLTDGTPWVDLSTLTVMLIEAAIALTICLLLPKITKIIPSTFVAIFVVTAMEWAIARSVGYPSTLVRDYTLISGSTLPSSPFLPYSLPPLNWETFKKIWPTGIAVFAVSIVESLLTFAFIGGSNPTKGSANRMAIGQGIANLFSAVLVGGMGGGGMVGQSVMNNKSGGISGLSSFTAGLTLLIFLVGAYPAVGIVPLSAIIGVLMYAVYHLVQWHAFITILAAVFPQKMRDMLFLDCKVSRFDTLIMLLVMGMTFFLDVAMGIIAACIIGALAYARDASNTLMVDRVLAEGEETVTYRINGPMFFASSEILQDIFTDEIIENDPQDVILFLEDAEIYDWSGMVALKRLYERFESHGKTVALSSLSPMSKKKSLRRTLQCGMGWSFWKCKRWKRTTKNKAREAMEDRVLMTQKLTGSHYNLLERVDIELSSASLKQIHTFASLR